MHVCYCRKIKFFLPFTHSLYFSIPKKPNWVYMQQNTNNPFSPFHFFTTSLTIFLCLWFSVLPFLDFSWATAATTAPFFPFFTFSQLSLWSSQLTHYFFLFLQSNTPIVSSYHYTRTLHVQKRWWWYGVVLASLVHHQQHQKRKTKIRHQRRKRTDNLREREKKKTKDIR